MRLGWKRWLVSRCLLSTCVWKLSFVQVRLVTPDTPGFIPNVLTSKPKTATSNSCAATSSEKANVRLYYQTSAESDLYCVVCHKSYKSFGTLKNHLRKNHGKNLELKCEKCDTTFDDGKSFGLHMARKTDCSKLKKKYVFDTLLCGLCIFLFR